MCDAIVETTMLHKFISHESHSSLGHIGSTRHITSLRDVPIEKGSSRLCETLSTMSVYEFSSSSLCPTLLRGTKNACGFH